MFHHRYHDDAEIMKLGRLINIAATSCTPYFQYFDVLIIRQKQMLFVGTEPNKTCMKQFFFGVFLGRGPPK